MATYFLLASNWLKQKNIESGIVVQTSVPWCEMMLSSGVADYFSLHHPPHLTTTQLAQASLKEGFKGLMCGIVQ